MIYLTYEEYKNIGGILDEAAFNRCVIRACGIVDAATHNRITEDLLKDTATVEFSLVYGENAVEIPIEDILSSVDVRVKHLCRELIEYLDMYSENQRQIVSESYSEGPITQSYTYSSNNINRNTDIDKMINDYLGSVTTKSGIPLLYWGCAK